MARRLLYVLLFLAWTAEPPVDRTTVLYSGLWRSPLGLLGPLFVSIPGLGLFPWRVLLLALVPMSLRGPRALRHREHRTDFAIVASVVSVAVTVVCGWMRGGNLYRASFPVWPFLA